MDAEEAQECPHRLRDEAPGRVDDELGLGEPHLASAGRDRALPCREHVAEVVLVSDAAIEDAQRTLWRQARIMSEAGGAAAYAALLSGAYRPSPGERVGVLVCGANVDPAAFARLLG